MEQKERRETFSVTLRSWSFTASTGQIGFFKSYPYPQRAGASERVLLKITSSNQSTNTFRSDCFTHRSQQSTEVFTGTAVTSELSSPTHHERTCGIQENQQWAWSHKKTFCPLRYQSCEFTILLLMDFRGALWQRSRQGFHQKITPSWIMLWPKNSFTACDLAAETKSNWEPDRVMPTLHV